MFDEFKKLWKPGDPLWRPVTKIINYVRDGFQDGIEMLVLRRNYKGRPYLQERVRMGANWVHAMITHRDGHVTNLGLSRNLLTNIGDMVLIGGIGGGMVAGNTLASNISSGAPTGTTLTGTGSVWTASNLGTPTLGCAGHRVYCAPNTSTNPVVWGNIVSNTTNVLTVDGWWKYPAAALGPPVAGTTPSNGDAFVIAPGGIGAVMYMGLTTNASAAAATNTTLTGEITTNGGSRALATFTRGANPSSSSGTFTLQKAFSITGTLTAVHRMGLFVCLTAAGADPLIFETTLSADATVVNGDTLTVTDTITVAGP
jgi:hypothetical protein